jgi:osmotically-inducible protein OsmY
MQRVRSDRKQPMKASGGQFGGAGPCQMCRRTLAGLAAAVILVTGLCGCAAYRKCGSGGCPGDAEIAARVQALFKRHAELEPPNLIDVQALDRVVYLYGLVDTDYERQMAESVASQATGVRKVVNSIGLSGNR